MLTWRDLRDQLRAQHIDLQLVANRQNIMTWRNARAGMRVLAMHPALLCVSEDSDWIHAWITGGRKATDTKRILTAVQGALNARLADDPRWFADVLGPPAIENLLRIRTELGKRFDVLVHDQRRLMIAVRNLRLFRFRYEFHFRLLAETDRVDDLIRFARRGGHGGFKRLDQAISTIFADLHPNRTDSTQSDAVPIQLPEPPYDQPDMMGSGFDLSASVNAIHKRYFGDLSLIPVSWSRAIAENRDLRSIRFGSYRSHPQPHIRLHPRLLRPWVSRNFVEMVIHHELCHWRQHCEPIRGEAHHSARFRRWEREFHGYEQAMAWERQHLPAILAGWSPPSSDLKSPAGHRDKSESAVVRSVGPDTQAEVDGNADSLPRLPEAVRRQSYNAEHAIDEHTTDNVTVQPKQLELRF